MALCVCAHYLQRNIIPSSSSISSLHIEAPVVDVEILSRIFMLVGCCPIFAPQCASCGWQTELVSQTTDHRCFNDNAVLSSLF